MGAACMAVQGSGRPSAGLPSMFGVSFVGQMSVDALILLGRVLEINLQAEAARQAGAQ